MRLCWLWGDYIPPDVHLSRAERKRVGKRINENSETIPNFWIVVLTMVVAAALVIGFPGAWLGDWLKTMLPQWSRNATHIVSYAAVGTVHTLICIWIFGRLYVPVARRSLCECGYPVCIDCGYSMLGLDDTTERCPECGATRETHDAIEGDQESSASVD